MCRLNATRIRIIHCLLSGFFFRRSGTSGAGRGRASVCWFLGSGISDAGRGLASGSWHISLSRSSVASSTSRTGKGRSTAWILIFYLTHWGRVTHIWVGNLTIIGSDNGLSPGRRKAIIWTNDGILLIGPLFFLTHLRSFFKIKFNDFCMILKRIWISIIF